VREEETDEAQPGFDEPSESSAIESEVAGVATGRGCGEYSETTSWSERFIGKFGFGQFGTARLIAKLSEC